MRSSTSARPAGPPRTPHADGPVSEPDDTLPLGTLPPRWTDPLALAASRPALEAALDPAPPAPEGRFGGRGLLGEGGHAQVFGVHDRLLDRPLAAKRLRTADREEHVRAFLAEARVMGALAHPAVIPVHDFGVAPGAAPWILMDRVTGEDLKQRIDRAGPVRAHDGTMTAVLDALARACDALTLAHDRGLLHRDLKPANIMLGAYGAVFVVDWGLALPRERWPWPGDAMGTPAYMAPEQARRDRLDARTDVWGIGACLYYALTGHPPHPGDRDTAFGHAAAGTPVVPVAERRQADPAPPALARLAEACLAVSPADRPGGMDRLRAELDRARHGSWRLPRRAVTAGEAIVRQGEPGDTAYLIDTGRFEVLQEGRGVLRVLGPGDVFGELSPILGAPRSATVRALEDGIICPVDGAALREWLDVGNLGGRFVQALAVRLRSLEAQFGGPPSPPRGD